MSWSAKDIITEVTTGMSAEAIQVGNYLGLKMNGEGLSYTLVSRTPGSQGEEKILILKQDLAALAEVLTALVEAVSPSEKTMSLDLPDTSGKRK